MRGDSQRRLRPSPWTKTAVIVGLVCAASAAVALSSPLSSPESSVATEVPPLPVYTFVSAPDLFNGDLGDVRGLPGWEPGDPNSWNASYAQAVDKAMGEMAAYHPDAVLVAGDLVQGHWGRDVASTGIFGPVATHVQRIAALRRAGNLYYGQWRSFWADHGIGRSTLYPTIGDHEIGDNFWRSPQKYNLVPTARDSFVDNLLTKANGARRFLNHPDANSQWDDTAYARYLTPKLLLVSLDVFSRRDGRVAVTVEFGQLKWLRQVLSAAPPDATIIVQGHTPVLLPVRTRGSSELSVQGGANSSLWQTLRHYDVDFYFNGEVHDYTLTQRGNGEPIQFSQGGLLAWGATNYIVGNVYADGRVEIDARELPATLVDKSSYLWQTAGHIAKAVELGDSVSVGNLTVQNGVITRRTGVLLPYQP